MIHRRAAEYRFALAGAIRGEAEGAAEEEYWHAVARLNDFVRDLGPAFGGTRHGQRATT